jgi:hypothetical protein
MFVNSDFSELLRLFKDNGVKYLVIGGYAVSPAMTSLRPNWLRGARRT